MASGVACLSKVCFASRMQNFIIYITNVCVCLSMHNWVHNWVRGRCYHTYVEVRGQHPD